MSVVFENINDFLNQRKKITGSIGFVPTLGGLHSGHISLIERSIKENDQTLASVFLNPAQFNDPEDLKKYPSSWADDLKILQDLKVDIVIKPDSSQIYPDDYAYIVNEKKLSKDLCGSARPGHFTGVLTVVMKLLNIVKADRAYFGEKDYQQFLLVKNMAAAFFLDTEIVPCPCLLYTSPSPRDQRGSRMPSSA